MNRFRHSALLVTGTLALAVTAFAQSGPATNRPNPPAPPRTDAPGEPINPNQNQAAPAAANPAAPATASQASSAPASAAEEASSAVQFRELNFAGADLDGDKRISLTEFSTYVESRMQSRATMTVAAGTIERFRQLDQDNDAYLSESEARSSPQSMTPQPASPPR